MIKFIKYIFGKIILAISVLSNKLWGWQEHEMFSAKTKKVLGKAVWLVPLIPRETYRLPHCFEILFLLSLILTQDIFFIDF